MDVQEKIRQSLKGFRFNSVIDWSLLGKEENVFVEEKSQILKLKKKSVLYGMRERPKGVYLIRKGKVKIDQVSYDGNGQILFIYTVGEVFGFRPLLSKEMHPVNAVALEDCELSFIPASHFIDLLQRSVVLSNLLLTSLSHEFTVLVNRISLFAQRGVKERLAFALLVLNEKYAIPNMATAAAEIKLSRTDLANYAGTSLENLVRTLSYFKEKNLIRVSGKSIYIINFEVLLILSGIEN